jgi:hypothetical protein
MLRSVDVASVNAQHINTDKLAAAMVDVINQYVRFTLPHHWGSGRTTIADGTHVRLRENNLMGSRHICYGGYGGIAYHHISDTYIALFTSFISRGVWEAVHILEALMKNRSTIQPATLHLQHRSSPSHSRRNHQDPVQSRRPDRRSLRHGKGWAARYGRSGRQHLPLFREHIRGFGRFAPACFSTGRL